MKAGLIAAAAAAFCLAGVSDAKAGAPCQARSKVLAKLAKNFSEAPVAIGMASNGGVLEVLAGRPDANASFTIILTMPNGLSCLLASGKHFEMLPTATAAKGDPV